jgi:hypothetical protein
VVQTQFLALQGMSRLVEVIDLVKQRLHPGLRLSGIVPCMYDSRMRLAREVLSELRRYFPSQVFRTPISSNVKLAESPSFGKTIFEYAPESVGARDFASLSHEVLAQAVLARGAQEPEPAATLDAARSTAAPSPAGKGKRRAVLEPVPPMSVPGSAPPAVPPSTPSASPIETVAPEGAPGAASRRARSRPASS